MPFNIRHTGIVVTDLEKSKNFYCNLLGFQVKKEVDEHGEFIDNFLDLTDVLVTTCKMTLDNGDMVELLHYKSHPEKPDRGKKITQIGCSHIALTVKNLDEVYDRLLSVGVELNSPPQHSPDGKVKVTFCKDPDGTFIELVEEQ